MTKYEEAIEFFNNMEKSMYGREVIRKDLEKKWANRSEEEKRKTYERKMELAKDIERMFREGNEYKMMTQGY